MSHPSWIFAPETEYVKNWKGNKPIYLSLFANNMIIFMENAVDFHRPGIGLCISYLMLVNKLSPTKTFIISLTFWGLEIWKWHVRSSHEVADKWLARTALLWKQENPLPSSLTWLLAGGRSSPHGLITQGSWLPSEWVTWEGSRNRKKTQILQQPSLESPMSSLLLYSIHLKWMECPAYT